MTTVIFFSSAVLFPWSTVFKVDSTAARVAGPSVTLLATCVCVCVCEKGENRIMAKHEVRLLRFLRDNWHVVSTSVV